MTKRKTTPAPYRQPYKYASPDIPMSAIRRFARQIAEKFKPEKIILFGSYAYGTPHNESDVDLLVVMPCRNTIDQAIRIKRAFIREFCYDLIVRKPKQLERDLRDGDWFLREIVGKGKLLYESEDVAVGSKGRGRHGLGATRRRQRKPSKGRSLLSLPTSRREVLEGHAPRIGRGHTSNA